MEADKTLVNLFIQSHCPGAPPLPRFVLRPGRPRACDNWTVAPALRLNATRGRKLGLHVGAQPTLCFHILHKQFRDTTNTRHSAHHQAESAPRFGPVTPRSSAVVVIFSSTKALPFQLTDNTASPDSCRIRAIMNQSPRPKNTPGRRRQGRNNNNNTNTNTPQKSYVSENDIPAYLSGSGEQHFAAPNTPFKAASGQKPRAKNNKPRNNKTGSGSPSHQNKQQPNHRPIPIEAPAAIFAGATFHASPAPASLPMPSFLARSSADSPLGKSSPLAHATASPQQEPSPPSTDSEDGLGFSQPSLDHSNDSPLEVFFRAQRAEKAKEHRAKSANAATPKFTPGPFPLPHGSPMEAKTVPRAQPQTQHQSSSNVPKSAGPGISAIELDGTPGRALGPAFSTPYSQRIRAARPVPGIASESNPAASPPQFDESQALLRMLHHGKPAFGQQPAFGRQPHQQQQYHTAPPAMPASQPAYAHYGQPVSPYQYSHQHVQAPYQQSLYAHNGPKIPNGKAQPQQTYGTTVDGDQISKMEASLRQVLKLDSSS
ncbi:hypothetical protein Micbo1qcDRAFT_221096 [Microdochium bolleyi]|uniref:Proteophosphoglycan 5 n=1 Tax=Microdochium bolleyi TaxID=196109 RepID=A0A136JBQ6_9PEZI|nr:hypothetical protein Micbo1qcDRAFT_221096 [Microdochium bolleyi]